MYSNNKVEGIYKCIFTEDAIFCGIPPLAENTGAPVIPAHSMILSKRRMWKKAYQMFKPQSSADIQNFSEKKFPRKGDFGYYFITEKGNFEIGVYTDGSNMSSLLVADFLAHE